MSDNTSKTVLAVAPHPDDETLGCGGTLLRHRREGDRVHWLILTTMSESLGFDQARMAERRAEIEQAAERYGMSSVEHLDFVTTQLDNMPMGEFIGRVSEVFRMLQPNIVYLPHRRDVHTDHRVAFDGIAGCCKWFRYPSVREVYAYETLSETEFGMDPDTHFHPNRYVDVTDFIDTKLEIMKIFTSEMGEHPFPRSERTIRALADLRGSEAGFGAAEAFQVLRQRA